MFYVEERMERFFKMLIFSYVIFKVIRRKVFAIHGKILYIWYSINCIDLLDKFICDSLTNEFQKTFLVLYKEIANKTIF